MIADASTRPRRRRPGFGLIEMVVTSGLLAVAMTATVQVVGWVALERKAVERRQRALLEAGNLLERLFARPWDQLTPEATRAARLSTSTASYLRGSSLVVDVSTEDGPPRKKLAVEIRWIDRSGRPEAPVRLVGWAYLREVPKR